MVLVLKDLLFLPNLGFEKNEESKNLSSVAVLDIFRQFFARITAFLRFLVNVESGKYPNLSRTSC